MEYKGYVGAVTFDTDAGLFHGDVLNTRDVITFQGDSVSELTKAFRESIDDYLAFCETRNETPDKPFSGQFVTRIPPDLHRQIDLAARKKQMSLNSWCAQALRNAVMNGTKIVTNRKSLSKDGTKHVTKRKTLLNNR